MADPDEQMCALLGLSETNELEKLFEVKEAWEIKQEKEDENRKQEIVSTLKRLGLDEEDTKCIVDELEAWEVKSNKELSVVKEEIDLVKKSLGMDEDGDILDSVPEVWEVKAQRDQTSQPHIKKDSILAIFSNMFAKSRK